MTEEEMMKQSISPLSGKDLEMQITRLDHMICVPPGTLLQIPLRKNGVKVGGDLSITPYKIDGDSGNEVWFAEVQLDIGTVLQVYNDDENYLPILQATFLCMKKENFAVYKKAEEEDEDQDSFE